MICADSCARKGGKWVQLDFGEAVSCGRMVLNGRSRGCERAGFTTPLTDPDHSPLEGQSQKPSRLAKDDAGGVDSGTLDLGRFLYRQKDQTPAPADELRCNREESGLLLQAHDGIE